MCRYCLSKLSFANSKMSKFTDSSEYQIILFIISTQMEDILNTDSIFLCQGFDQPKKLIGI